MRFYKKPILLIFIFLFISRLAFAQAIQLWGMCPFGDDAAGIVFKINEDGSSFNKLVDFNVANGASPNSSLIIGNDGKLYGTTWGGGKNNLGAIFSLNPVNYKCTGIYSFDSTTGCYPNGPVIQAIDGKLYGLALGGGLPFGDTTEGSYFYKGNGAIYSYDIATGIYTDEYNFKYTDGAQPHGGLIQATDGKLYGMTRLGGINDTSLDGSYAGGVLFSFDPITKIYTVLHEFGDSTGQVPYGSLIQASDGKLYGMASNGGNTFFGNDGVLFSFDIIDSSYADLINFHENNGGEPLGNLVEATDGNLYGMTSEAYSYNKFAMGSIFSFNSTTATLINRYVVNYRDTINGEGPQGSLIEGNNGLLYGMMTYGGDSGFSDSKGYGVIFNFNSTNNVLSVLHKFNLDTDGAWPTGDLIELSNIVTGKITASVCPGATVSVPFYVLTPGTIDTNNRFNAELSDSSGSFNLPDSIGTLNGNSSGYIIATIPSGIMPGNNYRIRVVSNKPALTGLSEKLNIKIGNPFGNFTLLRQVIVPPADSAIFMNQSFNSNYTYKWLFGDSTTDSTNLTIVSHNYTQQGTYTMGLVVYNNNGGGCSDTIYKQVNIQFSSTGIDNLQVNANKLLIYPNPSTSEITITYSKPIDELKITNILGQQIYDTHPQQNHLTLQLNDTGLYLVTIIGDNQSTTTKLLVAK